MQSNCRVYWPHFWIAVPVVHSVRRLSALEGSTVQRVIAAWSAKAQINHQRLELLARLDDPLRQQREPEQFPTNRREDSTNSKSRRVAYFGLHIIRNRGVLGSTKMKFLLGIGILILLLQSFICSAEFFSSTSSLEQLLHTEVVLLAELQSYVNEIREHAEMLQRWVQNSQKDIVVSRFSDHLAASSIL